MAETEVKSGASEPNELEKKIARQIEYYFGDANLKRDRFLQLQIREDNGWVPLETMIKFNRLKTLSADFDVIVGALEKSPAGLMEVSEDKSKIRRVPAKPLPEETSSYWKSIRSRSVYCKCFSVDDKLDSIQDFLDQFGDCIHIQMRRDKEKKFKGSVFAIYDSDESAQKFIDTEDLKYNDTEVTKMSKEDYFKMKSDERKNRRDGEKKKKQDERDQRDKDQVEAMQSEFDEFEKGHVMYFSGVNNQTSREDLKELFGDHGTIAWVDFERGQTEGTIRFSSETQAQEALDSAKAANEGGLQIRGCQLTLRVLEGEEEEQHWRKVFEDKSKIRLKKQQGRRGKSKRGGYQGRGRGGGRGGDRSRGRKTRFDSDEEDNDDEPRGQSAVAKETPAEAEKPAEQGVKRSANGDGVEEPAQKKEKTEASS